MAERILMTPQGLEKLKFELKQILTVTRPQNIKDIENARAHGDLSENAEYHAAKEKQSMLAAQIADLEDKIGRAEVVDPSQITANGKIVFGATVTLYDLGTEDELTYQIVGDVETNVKENKIGISSPIARGLIGKSKGDEVRVQTPKGLREFEVIEICYS